MSGDEGRSQVDGPNTTVCKVDLALGWETIIENTEVFLLTNLVLYCFGELPR
jgi:hypothetical protein